MLHFITVTKILYILAYKKTPKSGSSYMPDTKTMTLKYFMQNVIVNKQHYILIFEELRLGKKGIH